MALEADQPPAIPFPATSPSLATDAGDKSSSEPILQTSGTIFSITESSTTDLTLSDKLTALPSTPNLSKANRSPIPGNSTGRGIRRSIETSSSLPSVHSSGDLNALGLQWQPHSSPKLGSLKPSEGMESLKQQGRVSAESDRGSAPTLQSVKQAFSARLNRASDPVYPSPAQRTEQLRGDQSPTNNSRSRATSPLRSLLQHWSHGHRGHQRNEEPFIPVDPFRISWQISLPKFSFCPCLCCFADPESQASYDCDHLRQQTTGFSQYMTDTLPRLLYLYMLLRLPALYFSRVARIFEDADVSRPDIQRMIESCSRPGYNIPLSSSVNITSNAARHATTTGVGIMGHIGAAPLVSDFDIPSAFPEDWAAPYVSPALVRFKHSWEAFIDSLLREWKTLNVVSALLLSAILTMFQIPNAASDPLTRTAALLSLVCALMSLSYGCMYIVRFGTMRTMYRASRWAEEARKNDTVIWWNVWVMLSMPAVWISWSMIFFIISILSFVWRTGSVDDPEERAPLGRHAILGPRIAITSVFVLGMIYFILIVRTLKSYGSHWVLKNSRTQVTLEPMNVEGPDVVAPELRRGRSQERQRERPADERQQSDMAMLMTDSPLEKGQLKLPGDVTELEVPSTQSREGRLRGMFRLSREISLERVPSGGERRHPGSTES